MAYIQSHRFDPKIFIMVFIDTFLISPRSTLFHMNVLLFIFATKYDLQLNASNTNWLVRLLYR